MKCNASPRPSRYLVPEMSKVKVALENKDELFARHASAACLRCWRPPHGRYGRGAPKRRVGAGTPARDSPACGVNTAGRSDAEVKATGVGLTLVAVDEVGHRAVERGRDLEQRRDRGHHVVALDLVDRRCGHLCLDRQLLKRETPVPGGVASTRGPMELTIPSTCSLDAAPSVADFVVAGGHTWGPLDG